jgi:hypothetical protein
MSNAAVRDTCNLFASQVTTANALLVQNYVSDGTAPALTQAGFTTFDLQHQ